jgi:transmembrane sensor
LAWSGWRPTALSGFVIARMADHRTGAGETRDMMLADGSRVWLNAETAINEDFQPGLRRLRVVTGEILVETAPGVLRPFVVDTPHGRLRALGTRFTVRLENAGKTFVAVYEGIVEIRNKAEELAVVPAGRQTRFSARALGPHAAADPAREAWSRGVLLAGDIILGEVVAELRRYRTGHLGVAPEVAGLRVFGSFPLKDADEALAMLETILPIRIKRTLPWWVSIEPKPAT